MGEERVGRAQVCKEGKEMRRLFPIFDENRSLGTKTAALTKKVLDPRQRICKTSSETSPS